MKKISDRVYNLRCPYCGDSKKSLKKARGYIYFKNGSWHYYCHNCGIYKPYKKFILEHRNLRIEENSIITNENFEFTKLNYLKPVLSLESSHQAIKYLEKRKIPRERWQEIYYCANPLFVKNKFIYNPSIAFVNKKFETVISIIFRAVGDDFPIKHFCHNFLDEIKPYNYYNVNKSKKIYIVEGIIDSLFLKNSVSILGINKINSAADLLELEHVLVLDNEPYKKETISAYEKAIEMGFNVFIWPQEVPLAIKDINDYILSGKTQSDLERMISENTYKGLSAKLRLTKYKL